MHDSPPQLADILDRLAGAFELQTRTLLDLKSEIGRLADTLKEVENRLDSLQNKPPVERPSLENKPSAAPASTTPKPKAKKRPK